MEKKYFKGSFKFLDYSISHKVLLLRNNDHVESTKNVDLVFESVFYLEIPTTVKDFYLYTANEEMSKIFIEKYGGDYYPQFNQAFYILESNNRKYCIGCGRVLIEENEFDDLKSSIK
ncbi:MAG: hypothetical protein IPG86_18515 [Chitinophagaceae bacterium]|nr:hypothetical protein [Chitinophagaceae bacterium]